MPLNNLITIRKGPEADWISSGSILASGEPGFDTTNSIFKIGDGVSTWENLLNKAIFSDLDVVSQVSGATLFNVEGTNGSLFSVVDNLDGTLMSVNNNAGLPVLEVFSDDSVVAGRFGQNDFVVSSSGNVGIGTAIPSTKLDVSGIITATDGNSTNWNTAYGWGNHASAGYQSAATALTTSTNFSGDVSGTYNNIVIADDSHNHIISNVDGLQNALDLKSPLNSPTFTGIPLAPTANSGTNTTQIATTAFVRAEITNLVDSAPGTLDTLNELAAALGDDPNFATTITNSIAGKAPLSHTHTHDDITDFDSAVSDLLPTISNPVDNRILTSTGTSTGINAESNATFDGTTLAVSGEITIDNLQLDGNTLSATNTNGNIIVQTSGTGALQRDSGGNSRGQYSVDLQNVRSVNTQVAAGNYSVIGGGRDNTASGFYSTVVGGFSNIASGNYSAILGGQQNNDNGHNNAFILGSNITATQANTTFVNNLDVASSGDIGTLKIDSLYHQNLAAATGLADSDLMIAIIDPTGSPSTETIQGSVLRSTLLSEPAQLQFRQGTDVERQAITPANGEPIWTTDNKEFYIGDGTTCGGLRMGPPMYKIGTCAGSITTLNGTNTSSGSFSTVSGGYLNCATACYSKVGGGVGNIACGIGSTVGGGGSNLASGSYSTVGGGYVNKACGACSTVSGGSCNTASSYAATVGGGCDNCASGCCSTVGGGYGNCASGNSSTIGGGGSVLYGFLKYGNTASGSYSTVGGGFYNRACQQSSTVSGGQNNTASGSCSTVGGGSGNCASGDSSTIGGGVGGDANGTGSVISGGFSNFATGNYSTVSGGYSTKASRYGEVAHAAGRFSFYPGEAQHSTFVARKNTTDATANVELFLNGSSERMTITAETTWTFDIKLSAYNDTDNTAAWWIIRGGIRRNAANGTALIGSLITERDSEGTMSGTSAAVTADDTNESLKIAVTGLAGKNIRWVAVVDVAQVSWGTP